MELHIKNGSIMGYSYFNSMLKPSSVMPLAPSASGVEKFVDSARNECSVAFFLTFRKLFMTVYALKVE